MIGYMSEAAEKSGTHCPETKFFPAQPETLEETGLPVTLLEDLVLKHLLGRGVLSGRELSEVICIPYKILLPILTDLKNRMFVAHRTTAAMGDFYYNLTDQGKQSAMTAKEYSSFTGAAPVVFKDYVKSVLQQSIRNLTASVSNLKQAYADIILDEGVLNTIGPAINSGRGIFLFGDPGNGKTTIAERIRNCFTDFIYIPNTLWVDGEIVQLYDPQTHEIISDEPENKRDMRWLKIKRPFVVVGGELTMTSLDIRHNHTLKICEAPLQLKANGGTFLIDDFGRQRMSNKDLLNRWIVPLEKHFDFLVLPNGKKIQVPFDELIIFSTNLNPKDLVDEAFLRRIPYKIEILSPSLEIFQRVFEYQCQKVGIPYDAEMFSYLIQTHYQDKRPFRTCHPRDILDQVIHITTYQQVERSLTKANLDIACKNYFAALDSVQ